jgi:methyl-accepting chemotaxis protein
MNQMNMVTQQNAASSEESSSPAAELSGQSEELAAMVALFQLDEAGAARKPAVAAKASPTATTKAVRARKNDFDGALARPDQIIPLGEAPQFEEF